MRASESTHQYNVEINSKQTRGVPSQAAGTLLVKGLWLLLPGQHFVQWPVMEEALWGCQEGQMELRCGGSPGSGTRLRVNPRAGQRRALCSVDSERQTCQALVKSGPRTQTQAIRPQIAGAESLRDAAHLGNPFSPRDSTFSSGVTTVLGKS